MYYVLALLGAGLAFILGLWYSVRRLAQDESTIGSLDANSKVKDAKIKTLDDRIVDSEYRRRAEERLRNAKIVELGDATAAGRLLSRKDRDPN